MSLIVDGYEFGRVMVSQINSSILRSISLMLDNIEHEIKSCHGRTDRVTTQCDQVNAPPTRNSHYVDIKGGSGRKVEQFSPSSSERVSGTTFPTKPKNNTSSVDRAAVSSSHTNKLSRPNRPNAKPPRLEDSTSSVGRALSEPGRHNQSTNSAQGQTA